MSPQREYRVGVIGIRGRGLSLARYLGYVEGARLVAVADLVPENLERAKQELGDVKTYPSSTEMFRAEKLDVAVVGTAANAHAPVTIEAARAGVGAVYCEKPMARSLAECDRMIEECRTAGTIFVMGHQRHWAPGERAIRHAIKEGAIGRPTNAYLTWASGRVGTEGTHKWDAFCYMLDDTVAWVRCLLDRRQTSTHFIFGPEMVRDPGPLGAIGFTKGTRLTIDGFNDVMMPYTYLFFGTRGRIELREWAGPPGPAGPNHGHEIEYFAREQDNTDPQYGRWELPRRPWTYQDPTIPPGPDPAKEIAEYATVRALRDVVHCLRTGDTPAGTGVNGRHALEIIAALHLSAERNMNEVRLPLTGDVLEREFDVR